MEFSLASMLPIAWYAVLVVAVFVYSLGDGFDLGLSTIYFLSKKDEERRTLLNSIGPVWDGNEVWLIIIFGGLFAGFPSAYGMLLSIFYMPVWTLVLLYIFRGCSLEFRSKSSSNLWKSFWDSLFCVSGLAISFFLGSLVGNMILGFPIAPTTQYSSMSWSLFFRPYAVLSGVLVVFAYAMHAVTFSLMKTTGELKQRISKSFPFVLFMFSITYFLVAGATFSMIPQAKKYVFQIGEFVGIPLYSILVVLAACALGICYAIKTSIAKKLYGRAFLFSAGNLLILVLSSVVLLFPNLLLSTVSSQYSYTIYNSAVNIKTLQSLLIIVVIGLPLIIAYAAYIYRVFRGKTDFPSIY